MLGEYGVFIERESDAAERQRSRQAAISGKRRHAGFLKGIHTWSRWFYVQRGVRSGLARYPSMDNANGVFSAEACSASIPAIWNFYEQQVRKDA